MEKSTPLEDSRPEDGPDRMQIGLDRLPWMRRPRWTVAEEETQPAVHPGLSVVGPILPRFLRPGALKGKDDKSHPTAYLAALRGWAVCIIFAHNILDNPQAIDYPFLRVLTHASAPVAILFITSGYMLSFPLLKLMRNQESTQLLQTLASSTLRRYLRLYIPTMLASFVSMLCVWQGWSSVTSSQGSFSTQLWDWIVDTLQASDPFHDIVGRWSNSHTFGTNYLPQMWTIPVEFRGSMLLFAFCTAAAPMFNRARMGFTWVGIVLCLAWQSVYGALFLMGMFVADLSMSCKSPAGIELPPTPQLGDSSGRPRSLRTRVSDFGFLLLLIVSLFLLSQPLYLTRDEGPFPWPFLYNFIPSWYSGPGDPLEYFWLGIGAFLLVLALEFCPGFQNPLRGPFSIYLGEISFGIYAMHSIVNDALYHKVLEPFRQHYLGNSPMAYAPGLAILILAVLWTADYFTRVDRRVAGLLTDLQNLLFADGSEKRARI